MINNKQGFTLMELLVSMAVAGVILAVAVTIFDDGMKIRDQQIDQNNLYSNLKVATSYLQDDIAQAGSFLGDQGYFRYYNSASATEPKKQFCVDFDSSLWPDWSSLKTAWEARFTGWTVDNTNEDMIEIWYGDGNVYSTIHEDSVSVGTTIDFYIQDDPVSLGFVAGDYILFFDTGSFETISDAAVGGSKSSSSYVTVLANPVSLSGNNVKGQLALMGTLPYTDPYQAPYATTIDRSYYPDDMVYKLHRVVYGVVSKTITQNGITKTIKMLIRDNFSDPTGASRYNPSIIATNVEQFKLSTIFKLDTSEVGSYDDNYFNSVSGSYYTNTPGKMFALTLDEVLGLPTDPDYDLSNENEQDRDPRDLRKIQVELLSISTKRYMQERRMYNTGSGIVPSIYSTPAMGVVAYTDGTKSDARVPKASSPDWFKHVKLTTEIGLRALRLKDSAVSAE
ncbi:MAG: type II secretion system protein [Acidobacteria bacterium]|nr:type II secretion system protein [Acidobacteriota bacterium]